MEKKLRRRYVEACSRRAIIVLIGVILLIINCELNKSDLCKFITASPLNSNSLSFSFENLFANCFCCRYQKGSWRRWCHDTTK